MESTEKGKTYSLRELTEILLKTEGIHEGLYNLSIEMMFAVGAVGPSPEKTIPGASIGISKIGISMADKVGPHTVDAAEVNPKKKTK